MPKLNTFGNSLTVGFGVALPADVWANKLAAALSYARVNCAINNGMAGDMGRACDGFVSAVADISTVDAGINDQRTYNVDPAKLAGYYIPLMREVLLATAAPQRTFARGAMTFTGAWTDIPGSVSSVGKYTTQNGAKASATVSGTAIYIGFLLTESPAANSSVSVTIDGVAKPPIDATATGVTTALGWNCPPASVRYGGLAAGPHVVEVTVTGPNGKYFYVMNITGNAQPSRPRVFVGNIARWSAAGYASFAPAFGGSDANVDAYNTALAALVAELVADGFNLTLVDLHALLNTTTDLQADGAHWSVAGNDKVFNAFLAAITGPVVPPTYRDATVKIRNSDDKAFAFDGTNYYPLN